MGLGLSPLGEDQVLTTRSAEILPIGAQVGGSGSPGQGSAPWKSEQKLPNTQPTWRGAPGRDWS